MADYIQDKKLTQDQADRLQAPMELDLMALFKIMEADILETIDNFKGTPDQFINEIISLFEPTPYGEPVKKNLYAKAIDVFKSFRERTIK